jgi:glycosyltransferase involved in cell wall biosynthesis
LHFCSLLTTTALSYCRAYWNASEPDLKGKYKILTKRHDDKLPPFIQMLEGKRICRIATVPFFIVAHLKRQLEFLRDIGMEVIIVSSDGPERKKLKLDEKLQYRSIEIPRNINLLRDVTALVRLLLFFRQQHFDIIHSTTPKAGLLAAVAGNLAGVPIRLHTWTGQQWVGFRGIKRLVSRMADRMIGILDTRCYADSRSQMRFLVKEGIIKKKKISVIGENSLSGVDLERFDPAKWSSKIQTSIRERLSISPKSKVILFVGRIAKDKGIFELVTAFEGLLNLGYDAVLLLVGPFDQERGGVATISGADIEGNPRVRLIGYSEKPEQYLAVADIFCLPSYREGFGTVVIEAAAMGIPAVGTRIDGIVDAIVDGETGLLVPPQNETALMDALKLLIDNSELRSAMGRKARQRCLQHFNMESINRALADEYARLLTNNK